MGGFQKFLISVVVIGTISLAGFTQYSTLQAVKEINVSQFGASSQASDAESAFRSQTAGDTTVYQQQVSALWGVKDVDIAVANEVAANSTLTAALLSSQTVTNWLLTALVSVLGTIALTMGKRRKIDSIEPAAESTAIAEG